MTPWASNSHRQRVAGRRFQSVLAEVENADLHEGSEMRHAMDCAGTPFVEQEIRLTCGDLTAVLDEPSMFLGLHDNAQVYIGVRVGSTGGQ